MNPGYVVALNQNLDVIQARNLHKELEQALASRQSILIVADEVAKISTASLQVLLSFVIEAAAQNIEWHWQTKPSDALQEAIELCGLTAYFEQQGRTI